MSFVIAVARRKTVGMENVFDIGSADTTINYNIVISGGTIKMKKYVCDVCGWEYDEAQGAPDFGIAPRYQI